MNLRVLALLFSAALLLGVGNNVVNPHRVEWIGSPEILPKPEGWPALSFAQGVAGGFKTAGKELARHGMLSGIGALLLVAGILASRRRHKPLSSAVKSWLRVALALMFLFAAYPKFTDPKGFAMLVAQYQFLPSFAVNGFSALLPAGEIVVGLALLFTPFEKDASAGVLLLLLMFIVALGQALARGLGIACGCFDIEGAADAGETWFSLLRDIVLLFPVTWMWLKAERRWPWHF